jgi:hypothetical protein
MVSFKIGRIIVAALAVAACFIAPVAAQKAGSITSVLVIDRSGPPQLDEFGNVIPNTGALTNPCTFEKVNLTGSMTITTLQTLDNQGNIKTDVGVVSKGIGSGVTTGNLYPFNENQNFSIKLDPGSLEFFSTFTDRLSLKGPKSADNWVARAVAKLAVLADGTVKTEMTRITSDNCKG